jgi:predicted PurR-regulated permease PerM
MANTTSELNIQKIAAFSIIVALALLLFYLLKSVLAPLVLSVILALVFLPIANWLEKYRFNRFFSTLTTVVSIALFFIGIAIIGFFQFQQLIGQYSNLEQKFFAKINHFTEMLPDNFQPPTMSEVQDVEKILPDDLSTLQPVFSSIIKVSGELFSTLFFIPIFMFFILFYRGKVVRFSNKLETGDSGNINKVLQESKSIIQKYLSGMGLVILIIASLATLGLWLMGIKYALLLGILSAVLTIVPYIGTITGALIPILFAFLTKDSAAYGLGVMALYAVIQIAEANLISPLILGNSVNVNPFVSILALLVMGPFWGIIGMIVAVPLTAILVVLISHSKRYAHINILLKNE